MSENELKPCPFCGGSATLKDDYCSEPDETRWMVWHLCEDGPKGQFTYYDKPACMSIETPWFDSREKAIEVWNARAERTCHALPPTVNRICTVTNIPSGISMDFGYWRCSECGMNNFEGARHCMGCGAKLVE